MRALLIFSLLVLCSQTVQSGTGRASSSLAPAQCEICCKGFDAESKTVQCCKNPHHKYHLNCHIRKRIATPELPEAFCEHCQDVNNPSIVVPNDLQNEFNDLIAKNSKNYESQKKHEDKLHDDLYKQLTQHEKALFRSEKKIMWSELERLEDKLNCALQYLQILQDTTVIQERHLRLNSVQFYLEQVEEGHQWLLNRQFLLLQETLVSAQPLHRLAQLSPDQQTTLENAQNLLHQAEEQESLQYELQRQFEQAQYNLEIARFMSHEQRQDQLRIKHGLFQGLNVRLQQRHAQLHDQFEVVETAFYQLLDALNLPPDQLKKVTMERLNELSALKDERRMAQEQQQQQQQEQINVLQRQISLGSSEHRENLQNKLKRLRHVKSKQNEYFQLRQEELALRHELLKHEVELQLQHDEQEPHIQLQKMQLMTSCLQRYVHVVSSLRNFQRLQHF